jgi:diguanylate cyclase (GGDEF)-like protein
VLLVRFIVAMQMGMYDTAYRDSLTHLYTRRRVMQRVRQLGARPGAAPAALVLLDVDHFKRINDRHGHDLGDRVLQQVAAAITASIRSSDMAARWGGEEFLILMPDTSLGDARQVAERLLQRIREHTGALGEGVEAVTATLAVAPLLAGDAFRDALQRTDKLLYQGKQQGRDRVMLAAG